MLVELKRILDKYTEEELRDMDLWIDAKDRVEMICIEERAITLITDESMKTLQINDNIW